MARDGRLFETEEGAVAHENTLPDATLRAELEELIDECTDRHEGIDTEVFIDALLERYNVEKKPVLFTGELRTR